MHIFASHLHVFYVRVCFRYNIILSLKNPYFKFIILNIFLIINEINECSLRTFFIGRLLIYRLYQKNIYIVMLRYETKTHITHTCTQMDICYWIYYDFKAYLNIVESFNPLLRNIMDSKLYIKHMHLSYNEPTGYG